jgi:hypothetical protein
MQRTMAWRIEGRLLVVVHGSTSPANLEWQRFLKEIVEGGSGGHFRVLIVSHGGGPDGSQREALMRAVGNAPAPTAIMTDSPLMRAITTALSFFNRKTKSLGLAGDDEACGFLGLSADERGRAQALRAELEVELGLRTARRAGSS